MLWSKHNFFDKASYFHPIMSSSGHHLRLGCYVDSAKSAQNDVCLVLTLPVILEISLGVTVLHVAACGAFLMICVCCLDQ